MSTLDNLLDAIGRAPALPGARCRGRHHLFDGPQSGEDSEVVAQRHAQAVGLCQRCPALDRCREWSATLPRTRRPPGVVAGEIPKPVGRPANTTRK
ncbi:MAG: WhiB family transcriptional regulator [Mycolicibacterium rufum]|nr:WhiB family transcriptional regulator [Mycolicibacterium rufum]